MYNIGDIAPDPNMLMFIDEAARDRRTSMRKTGYVLLGSQLTVPYHFVHGTRVSILPVLTLDGIIAYDIIPGAGFPGFFMMSWYMSFTICSLF